MNLARRRACRLLACFVTVLCLQSLHAAEPQTGPETEKRFPPLKVAAGFKATLFACDPLIEYPSVLAAGPRPGAIFVAVDYMTGLGTEIVRKSEVRLVEDTDHDGYADKATVFAGGFNSIEGITYHDGTVYVMHAPFLTALRDTDDTGVADERTDLLTGLGLAPEQNPVRLHCANGVTAGHDGWLYLAVGDNGVNVPRPEGDRLVYNGGGILRCRKDGRELHVFATGLRNIYDVALDEELNVFVRDNENDGGDYKIRVCQSFFGADHGYPYHYYERPAEALPPLADLGLGSSAGGVAYLERQFPAEYRGNLFFCEWGRSVVRYPLVRSGSSFAQPKELEFAAGADNDPYGFKPTDVVVQRDGTLMISDYADGQRPKRGRGRIYHVAYIGEGAASERPLPKEVGLEQDIKRLNSESYYQRCDAQAAIERNGKEGLKLVKDALEAGRLDVRGRRHAVWITAHLGGLPEIDDLLHLVRADPDPSVRVQAVRAIADFADEVRRHRVDVRLAAAGKAQDPRVLLEVVVSLGRLRWRETPEWLLENVKEPDAALTHAAMQALRRCDNWPAVLKLLDLPDAEPMRGIALLAVAEQAVPEVVDGLIERLAGEKTPARRQEYADALARVYKQPGPWTYWGYRPGPRPANTAAWERTERIEQAFDGVLGDPDAAVRLAVLRRMQREKVPTNLATLVRWMAKESQPEPLQAILDSLGDHPAGTIRDPLAAVVAAKDKPLASRLAALALFAGGLDAASEARLLALAGTLEDGPLLAEAIRLIGKRPSLPAADLLTARLASREALVRAAAAQALAELNAVAAAPAVRKLLADSDAAVRRAAAAAAGNLGDRPAAESLVRLTRDPDPLVRRASFESLRLLKETGGVPAAVDALNHPQTQVAALAYLAEHGGPEHSPAIVDVARQNPSADIVVPALTALSSWSAQQKAKGLDLEKSIAELHGSSGVLACWRFAAVPHSAGNEVIARYAKPPGETLQDGGDSPWKTVFGSGLESRLNLGPAPEPDAGWLAYADVELPEKTPAQFLSGSNSGVAIWLNGKAVHRRDATEAYRVDSLQFDAELDKGRNRVLVHIPAAKGEINFHVRFRRKSATAGHEKLTQAALSRAGNVERGRQLFANAERTQCIKCHRLGEVGERIGPELTGVGGRFSRIHLVESILTPSRTIASSFHTLTVTLTDGRVLSGVKVDETPTSLTLGDNQGKKHVLLKAEIEAQRLDKQSAMPEGLEKPLSVDEFVDLVGFLASQKENRP